MERSRFQRHQNMLGQWHKLIQREQGVTHKDHRASVGTFGDVPLRNNWLHRYYLLPILFSSMLPMYCETMEGVERKDSYPNFLFSSSASRDWFSVWIHRFVFVPIKWGESFGLRWSCATYD